jgi:hypothetical protein
VLVRHLDRLAVDVARGVEDVELLTIRAVVHEPQRPAARRPAQPCVLERVARRMLLDEILVRRRAVRAAPQQQRRRVSNRRHHQRAADQGGDRARGAAVDGVPSALFIEPLEEPLGARATHPQTRPLSNNRLAHRIASRRVASRRVASHRIASHRVAPQSIPSHRIAYHSTKYHRVA